MSIVSWAAAFAIYGIALNDGISGGRTLDFDWDYLLFPAWLTLGVTHAFGVVSAFRQHARKWRIFFTVSGAVFALITLGMLMP